MGRLVGPHEKRAPAPLPRSLATQTLSCANRSSRCKARPNQCHAPQVGGRRWACSRLGRPGQSRVSVGRPDQAPPVPEIRRGKQLSDDPNTRVRVSPPASPDPKHSVVDHDQAFRCGWASVTGAHPATTAVNAGKGHWGRVQRMHASACCSGEFSELGVHAKALEGFRSLRATTYHLLRNVTCRDYLRAWVRVLVRPRTYWGRMMPEKILGTRSARSGGLSARARPGGHWGRMIARPVVASPCSGLSGPQTVQDQLH